MPFSVACSHFPQPPPDTRCSMGDLNNVVILYDAQSACLVFNPIMVDNYAAFFNCTPVGRASDSMMAPT